MDFKGRIDNVKRLFMQKGIDFFVIEDPLAIFYLTGISISTGKFCISRSSHKLFVDGRYLESVTGRGIATTLLSEESFLDFFNSESAHITVGFDSRSTSFAAYQQLLDIFKKFPKNEEKSREFKLIGIDHILKEIRAIKEPEEIEKMKKSARLNWEGMQYIRSLLKEGVTEKELAFEYEIFCRKKGAQKVSFDPIIAFGANSSMPHHRSDSTPMQKNDVVLIDIGIVLDNYHSDLTRTFFIDEVDPLLQKFYTAVREAHKEVLSICRPGTKIGELDEAAQEVFARSWYNKYFLHSLGHGIGLEVHEFPRIKMDSVDKDSTLKAGEFITIEPGLYKAGLGGIRYEDTILITETGYENLYPEESF